MTATEDRLTDALHAAARSVTAPTLRRLGDHPAPGHVPAERPVPRHRLLAAVASAAAVVLIAGVVVAISAGPRTTPPGGSGAPPRYYVEIHFPVHQLVVRATATGRVSAVLPRHPVAESPSVVAVAAASDRTFFAEYTRSTARTRETRIYRFRLTAAGRVTRLAPVPGGNLGGGLVASNMAATTDGSRLALGIQPAGFRRGDRPSEIIVLDTRTGARTTWRGGLTPPGGARGQNPRSQVIGQLSWTANGRELAYLAAWTCHLPPDSTQSTCGDAGPLGYYEEVRALYPAGRGGRLSSGRLLLRDPAGDITRVVISADGSRLTAATVTELMIMGGPTSRELTIADVSARTGRTVRVRYRVHSGAGDLVTALAPGAPGQYLILINGRPGVGRVNGWIGRGRLHRLAPSGQGVSSETW